MRRIGALISLAVALVAATIATSGAGADDVRTYKIEMYNAFGIVDQSEVRVAGVNAGVVTDLGLNAAKQAVVEVELSGDLAVLGSDTTCASEPQSLIAEYFIDCEPAGEPLPEGATIPASRVTQTVQPDLVQNTLRDPFRDRLRLLINEFGTGLAGNSDALNDAIRLGAPALTELQGATATLARQRNMIRDLQSDSREVIDELAKRREDVVRFIDEAEDLASISNTRSDDVGHNFERLDDFLAELEPTLAELDNLAREQTPLLSDLGAAAPELNRLATSLPPFNREALGALTTLGDAADVGRRALGARGQAVIASLARAGRNAPITAEILADLLRDLDDPRRAVEIDERVADVTDRTSTEPGTRNTMGYTGLEGFMNYAYYQALALNQFDQVGHMLHIGLYEANTGDCGAFSSGRDPATGELKIPLQPGATEVSLENAADCISWLGPKQPGITEDLNLPKYHPSVCPEGTKPEAARIELCDPDDATSRAAGSRANRSGRSANAGGPGERPGSLPGPGLPQTPEDIRGQLEDLLDLPDGVLDRGALGKRGGKGGIRAGADRAAEDLLDFLFKP
ncbi:MAG: MlaD family protein [Actinomycetota bacterium]|nr:MlaD family protein [Actinomycetota bacterium]